ncbi:MAG: crossover junction endodeoxyribonuclease RuvC [Rickettsiales bacterium]|nr:crossover junction endodeoxyribonuclease RuvC [Rickettsiales bacterium]
MARKILGIDPGLQKTGWGIIESNNNSLRFIDCGIIRPNTKQPLASRLLTLHQELQVIISTYTPSEAAIEETFVSVNGASTLKLGQARGALLLSLSSAHLPVSEYAATLVKKTVTGVGRAEKGQVGMMVQTLMPQARERLQTAGEDALDALAIAICHSHSNTLEKL